MSAEEIPEEQVDSVLQDYVADVDGEQRLEVDVDGRRHTVELRSVYEFERDILDRLIEQSADTSVSGGAVPIKGEWVHGWLNVQFEDYINNIWKNYQFFIKYIEAKTSQMQNISTFQRSPGTYDSMYRYLLVLEDLGLIERFRREEVPQSEYDFPVPQEFRKRTFIRLQSDFDSRKSDWENPYEARYPDGEKPDEPEEDEQEQGLEAFRPTEDDGETEEEPDDTGEDEQESGLGQFTGDDEPEEQDEGELPESDASIEDFQNTDNIGTLVENSFPEAIERAFEDAPIPTIQVDSEDFSVGRIAVVGTWAVGEATPGEDILELVVSIDDTNAQLSPGFIPSGIGEHLPDVMKENSPYDGIFPNYFVVSSFNSVFKKTVDEVVRNEQSELIWYSIDDGEMKEL